MKEICLHETLAGEIEVEFFLPYGRDEIEEIARCYAVATAGACPVGDLLLHEDFIAIEVKMEGVERCSTYRQRQREVIASVARKRLNYLRLPFERKQRVVPALIEGELTAEEFLKRTGAEYYDAFLECKGEE